MIPPYYPDHSVTRADWAAYLDAISEADRKIGLILRSWPPTDWQTIRSCSSLAITARLTFAASSSVMKRGCTFRW